jgi:hypothetical protein
MATDGVFIDDRLPIHVLRNTVPELNSLEYPEVNLSHLPSEHVKSMRETLRLVLFIFIKAREFAQDASLRRTSLELVPAWLASPSVGPAAIADEVLSSTKIGRLKRVLALAFLALD